MKVTILILTILTVPCIADEPVPQLAREGISNADRDALVESLKHAQISTTAPTILRLLRDYESAQEPGRSEKPWMNDHHSHRAKVWYASAAVWDALFAGKRDDPSKAAILLKLLNSYDDTLSPYFVFEKLRLHWTSDAEKRLADLVKREGTPADTKLGALRVLIERAGEPHVRPGIGFIQSAPETNKASWFGRLFNVGDQFHKYSRGTQAEIVTLGFKILEADARPGTSVGYQLARQLGYFVKVPGRFAPSEPTAQPQGNRDLDERFFIDTVENALQWRRENPLVVPAR